MNILNLNLLVAPWNNGELGCEEAKSRKEDGKRTGLFVLREKGVLLSYPEISMETKAQDLEVIPVCRGWGWGGQEDGKTYARMDP